MERSWRAVYRRISETHGVVVVVRHRQSVTARRDRDAATAADSRQRDQSTLNTARLLLATIDRPSQSQHVDFSSFSTKCFFHLHQLTVDLLFIRIDAGTRRSIQLDFTKNTLHR